MASSETLHQNLPGQAGSGGPVVPVSGLWWSGYERRLTHLSPRARAAVGADCAYIADRGVLKAEFGDEGAWPADRVRRGLVMGAVQSGKTASMFGVAARALDSGVDILVVLSGTRLSLWQQTVHRFHQQMDLDLPHTGRENGRILRPKMSTNGARQSLSSLYEVGKPQVRAARRRTPASPLVFFALKQSDHLQALARSLRSNVFPSMGGDDFHMLVLDDEADDGSVLDAAVEASQDPIYGNLKQLPRFIAKLWEPTAHTGGLHATYVAYTATPQANFLQSTHNPLAPDGDFVMSLRTPFDTGELVPRTTTYREPQGLKDMYTGGEVFYRRGADAQLCLENTGDTATDLIEGVRAFLVAGAIRHLAGSGSMGPATARATGFGSEQEVAAACPAPHSMLIHPSAEIAQHKQTALDLLTWAGGRPTVEAEDLLRAGVASLPDTVATDLAGNEALWRAVHTSYQESAQALAQEFSQPNAAAVPAWEQVREALVEELIPGTRVSIINSHPDSDDRPEYEPTSEGESWFAPRDLCTIFVSGNVMSRGITLEGLTTTLFLRESNQPLADTQMQMQRWFGYRGQYLHLCRLVASPEQLALFAQFHENDEGLRRCVVQTMNEPVSDTSIFQVLQGRGYVATAKIANLGQSPLAPGPKPFVSLLNAGVSEDPNVAVVADLFTGQDSTDVVQSATLRGRILDTPISLSQAANVLTSLRYDGYYPSPTSRVGFLWANLHARIREHSPTSAPPPFYAPPAVPDGQPTSQATLTCPYAIAAYLRLWDACLTRHVRGLLATDDNALSWPMVDLNRKTRTQPTFWVGIRYGDGRPMNQGPLASVGFDIQTTSRSPNDNGTSKTWGTRNPDATPDQYRGDELFDYYHHKEPTPPPGQWRPPGAHGQILFFVNHPPGQTFPTISVGLAVPAGGPDQIAALTTQPGV